jgi:hypothetical protein
VRTGRRHRWCRSGATFSDPEPGADRAGEPRTRAERQSRCVASKAAAADRYLKHLDHMSHISWRRSVAHHSSSDHIRGSVAAVCSGHYAGPGLTCADTLTAVPRRFRKPRRQATYGGIWLHTRGEAGMPVAAGQRAIGLIGMGAPSRIRTCAHGSGDRTRSGRRTGLTCGDAPCCSLGVGVLSQLSRGRRRGSGRGSGRAGQRAWVLAGGVTRALDLVALAGVAFRAWRGSGQGLDAARRPSRVSRRAEQLPAGG